MPVSRTSERVYHVGAEQFAKAGEAVDRAREIARALATATPSIGHHDVVVVRSDGDTVRVRGLLDGRGRPTSITVHQPGRRW